METASGRFAIGTLSKGTGCKVETIRYYERSGLLPAPARSPGGYRLYGTEHLKRLAFVRRARALGFSIDEVRQLLELADHHRRPCAGARRVAASHLEDVRARLADLRAMERALDATIARCADGKEPRCPVIEALYGSVAMRTPSDATRRAGQGPDPLLPRPPARLTPRARPGPRAGVRARAGGPPRGSAR